MAFEACEHFSEVKDLTERFQVNNRHVILHFSMNSCIYNNSVKYSRSSYYPHRRSVTLVGLKQSKYNKRNNRTRTSTFAFEEDRERALPEF